MHKFSYFHKILLIVIINPNIYIVIVKKTLSLKLLNYIKVYKNNIIYFFYHLLIF